MAKSKGVRIQVTLEHRSEQGVYRYHTSKNRQKHDRTFRIKKIFSYNKKTRII